VQFCRCADRARTAKRIARRVESTRNPEFDACRILQARGITGTLQVWRVGKARPDMTLDIARASRLTIRETDAEGPRLVRWETFSPEAAQNAPVYRRVCSRTGDRESASTQA